MMRQMTHELANEHNLGRVEGTGVSARRMRMLCATDLSARSRRVVQRAAFLANQLDAQLILLHVVPPGHAIDRAARIRAEVVRQLPLTLLPAGSKPQIALRVGDCVHTIAAVARDANVDLIVLGARERKPLAPLIGATAERVSRLARCPTLIVNIKPRMRYGAVVFAAQVSDTFVRVARVAASLRLLDAPSVSIVHGLDPCERRPLYSEDCDLQVARRGLQEWEKATRTRLLLSLDAAGVERSPFQIFFHQRRTLRAIQRVIRRIQSDLLIVGTKDRSALNRMVRGSVANDALRSLECDILVVAPDLPATESVH